jgi:hypothetical protein
MNTVAYILTERKITQTTLNLKQDFDGRCERKRKLIYVVS